MLQVDPKDRPTAREILLHAWFKEDNTAIKDLLAMNSSMVNKDIMSHSLLMHSIRGGAICLVGGQTLNIPQNLIIETNGILSGESAMRVENTS